MSFRLEYLDRAARKSNLSLFFQAWPGGKFKSPSTYQGFTWYSCRLALASPNILTFVRVIVKYSRYNFSLLGPLSSLNWGSFICCVQPTLHGFPPVWNRFHNNKKCNNKNWLICIAIRTSIYILPGAMIFCSGCFEATNSESMRDIVLPIPDIFRRFVLDFFSHLISSGRISPTSANGPEFVVIHLTEHPNGEGYFVVLI